MVHTKRSAFSLIELVIVVVIIGIIAAIAIPRMSQGSAGASDNAVAASLRVMRTALDLYQTEHAGTYPSLANFTTALTQFSDASGSTFSTTKNTATGVVYGPYLRKVPTMPNISGASADDRGKDGVGAADGTGIAWIYTAATGDIKANVTAGATDSSGKLYSDY